MRVARELAKRGLRVSPASVRSAGLVAARARGRIGGRPPPLSESDLRVAQILLKDGELTVAQIAERLHVAPSTLYKHVPRPRSSTNDDAPSALRS